MKVFVLLAILVTIPSSYAHIYKDKCEMAKALQANGLPRNQLPDWVCLVQAESRGNTAAKGKQNKDKSYDFGLFQINSRYWCKIGSVGGDCRANCNDFLNDDIRDDVKCALLIYKRQKFRAWYGWRRSCQKSKPDLSSCGI